MRALYCRSFGPPESLAIEEIPAPTPRPNQLVVRAEACGVNFSDTLAVQGKYQVKSSLPFVPGGEVAGTVIKVGSEVEGFSVGDRVVAGTDKGAYAEEVLVDPRRAMHLPPSIDSIAAAAFFVNYGTALHALCDRGRLKSGETVLVLGAAGGIGIAGIEIAKAFGATVIAAASTASKLEICRAHGADHLINYSEEDLAKRVKEITKDAGVDIIYDPVGGHHTEAALRVIAWLGRLLVIGFAAGRIPQIPLNIVLLKGCSIIGLTRTPFLVRDPQFRARHFKQLVKLFEAGVLHPHVSKVFALDQAPQALIALQQHQLGGKFIVVPDAGKIPRDDVIGKTS